MTELEEHIKEIVYNDDNIVSCIEEAPQTYNTILKNLRDEGTLQVILRRRVRRLLKQQRIWKMRIPGTRFGVVLLCHPEKKYTIFVTDGFGKTRVFYGYDYKKNSKCIILEKYWELKGPNMNKWEYNEDTINIPLYAARAGGCRLW